MYPTSNIGLILNAYQLDFQNLTQKNFKFMKNMIDQLSEGKPEMALIILLQNAKSFQEELSKFNEIKLYLKEESVKKYLDKIEGVRKTLESIEDIKHVSVAYRDLEMVGKLTSNLIRDINQIFNKEVSRLYIKDLRKVLNIIESYSVS